MGTPLEDVLKRVAAGELTPEEALRLIDADQPGQPGETFDPAGPSRNGDSAVDPAAGTTSAGAEPPRAPAPGATPVGATPVGSGASRTDDALHEPGSGRGLDDDPPPSASTYRRGPGRTPAVRVLAAYRMVTVVGDPTVSRVHVTGHHSVRKEGDLLVVDAGWQPGARHEEGEEQGLRFAFAALPRGLSWATGWAEGTLTVRVNPELPLEIDATGASLRVSGLEGGGRLRLLASSLKVERWRGPLNLDARSSSVKGSLLPTGESRIAAEQSSIKVTLLPGTSLRMTATNRMGKLILPGRVSKDGIGFGETIHTQVGHGEGNLVLESVMSSVVIATEAPGTSR